MLDSNPWPQSGTLKWQTHRASGASESRWRGFEDRNMKTIKFTYWQDGDYYLGFLNDYPDYQTQARSKEELVRNLKDIRADLESGDVPYVRKVEELVIAE